jgi:hypothetical protein
MTNAETPGTASALVFIAMLATALSLQKGDSAQASAELQ